MPFGTLLLLAGPNGAGKTTVTRRLFKDYLHREFHMLNADERTHTKLRAAGFAGFSDAPAETLNDLFIESALEVESEAIELLSRGANVCLETVLSTPKYRGLVQQILDGGGRFELIYVALNHWKLSAHRVKLRAAKGGHDVPEDRLEARWHRSLKELTWFAPRANFFMVIDNSSDERGAPLMLVEAASGMISRLESEVTLFPDLMAVLREAFPSSV